MELDWSKIDEAPTFSSSRPGLLVFLLDTSGSMSNAVGKVVKIDAVSNIITNFLKDVVDMCKAFNSRTEETIIKNRLYVALIEYSGRDNEDPVRPVFSRYGVDKYVISTEELYDLLRNMQKNGIKNLEMDADGLTPMAEAFRVTGNVIEEWLEGRDPDAHPPIIINITDGEYNDVGDMDEFMRRIEPTVSLGTNYGNVLVYNIILSDSLKKKVMFLPKALPENAKENSYIRTMFQISIPVPRYAINNINKAATSELEHVEPGARGFILNATIRELGRIVQVGSLPMG